METTKKSHPQSNNAEVTPAGISAVELLGLNLINADTEIARHNHAVQVHAAASAPAPATASAAPANFIPLTAVKPREEKAPLDLEAVRRRLAEQKGPTYWRSLEQLAGDPEFQELVDREFGRQAPATWEPLSRREFLKVMGAGLALAGLAGCAAQPNEKIVPYVKAPEEVVPGKPLFYATAMPVGGGFVNGVLAESHMGRPTKIEGNPEHPASLGATDVFMQAAVLSLYDPERLQDLTFRGNAATWESFISGMAQERAKLSANRGAGLRILTEGVTSPTLVAQIQEVLRQFPGAKWVTYESVNADNAYAGAQQAFGRPVETIYRFDRAKRILSLDSDFLFESAGRVRYSRDFVDGRRLYKYRKWDESRKNEKLAPADMNRLYVAESTTTITGAMADHRMPLKASEIERLARAVYARVTGGAPVTGFTPEQAKWIDTVAKDLSENRGAGLVVAGITQPPVVHAIAHALNAALGNVGKTLYYTDPIAPNSGKSMQALRTLVGDINAGRVQTLMILGGNPVYTAPADLNLAAALEKFATRRDATVIRLGHYDDETSQWAHWVVPETHPLEAWSDGRSFDGTVTIVQPLIQPLYDSARSAHEVLAAFLNSPVTAGYDILRSRYVKTGPVQNGTAASGVGTGLTTGLPQASLASEKAWQTLLHDGFVQNSAARPVSVTVRSGAIGAASPAPKPGLEINFRPDYTLWDGRWANNGWLQELPKPLSRMAWDNALLISLNTAQKLGVTNNDQVTISLNGRSVLAPVYVYPGQPDDSLTVYLGGGRLRGGQVLEGIGFDANVIRPSSSPTFASGVAIKQAAGTHQLASVVDHHVISTFDKKGGKIDSTFDRDIVRVGELEKFNKDQNFLHGEFDRYLNYGFERTGDQSTERAAEGQGEHKGGEHEAASGEKEDKEGLPTIYNNGWPSDPKGVGPDGLPIYTVRRSLDEDEPARDRHNDPHVQYGYNGKPLPQWAMTIDLHACIGCNACTIGCQAENNIATVGRDQVLKTREMHWIRIDSYFKGDVNNPGAYFQPMACQHCEKAPCEPVCPVEATTHSAEGINEMTYNRCVGTKYCSNNCPYKVRRFNFLQYTDLQTPQIKLMRNPDVTTRARGVMEKCTYCIQRIQEARIQAENEEREIRDGDITTACAQACPTNAIYFGNFNDMQSVVRDTKRHPLSYGVLRELGTQPRTSYLARLRNPHPDLKAEEDQRLEASANRSITGHEDNAEGPISPTSRENDAAQHSEGVPSPHPSQGGTTNTEEGNP